MTAVEVETPPETRPGIWRRGRMITAFAVFSGLLLAAHSLVPNVLGNLGSLYETFLPWTAVVVPVLLVCALIRRSALAAVAVLLPAVVWVMLFGGRFADKRQPGGDVLIVSHNVNDANPDPAGTARALAASGAQLVALEELTSSAATRYAAALADSYPYHTVQGTVGLWSRYPLRDTRPVEIMPWTRALRSTVDTPRGPLAVFVAHLPSVRVRLDSGFTANQRDEAIGKLVTAVRADDTTRLVLVGDFNGTTDDRGLAPLADRLRSAQDVAGDGFGFTWPSAFPMARIDQIFASGVRPVAAWTLPATPSDHLPVAARLAF